MGRKFRLSTHREYEERNPKNFKKIIEATPVAQQINDLQEADGVIFSTVKDLHQNIVAQIPPGNYIYIAS